MMRTLLAFVKKDFLIETSYRLNFVVKTGMILVGVLFLFFIGKVVDKANFPILQSYGGSYFGFLLIGAAFTDYLGISLSSFSSTIRDGQLTGTLEIILTSPTPLPVFLISSSSWSYLFTSFRISLYLLSGVFLFGLDLARANWLVALAIFLLSILCYIAVGIIFAAFVLLVKRGEFIIQLFGGASLILGGMLFPVEILPSWLQKLAVFIPFTHSLRGLRLSLLEGHSLYMLIEDVVALLLFTLFFLMLAYWAFPYALRQSKIKGTLAQY